MKAIRHLRRAPVLLGLMLLTGVAWGTRVRAAGIEAGIQEKLGAQAALDVPLRDEDGNELTLRGLIDRPTILTLNYFSCTSLCTPLLNGVADALNRIGDEPGRDFRVITVSFDPKDTPEIARQKRINYLKEMKRPFPPEGWRFLTGSAESTKALADSVGFAFSPGPGGFAHPGALMVLTPRGKVSRYIYGVSFIPADLQMAVQEASREEVRPTIARILSFCYSYDPAGRRRVLDVTRVAGAATLAFAGGFVIFLFATGRSRKARAKEKPSA